MCRDQVDGDASSKRELRIEGALASEPVPPDRCTRKGAQDGLRERQPRADAETRAPHRHAASEAHAIVIAKARREVPRSHPVEELLRVAREQLLQAENVWRGAL